MNNKNVNLLSSVPKNAVDFTKYLHVVIMQGTRTIDDNTNIIKRKKERNYYLNPNMQNFFSKMHKKYLII